MKKNKQNLEDWQIEFKNELNHYDGVKDFYCYSKEVEVWIAEHKTQWEKEARREILTKAIEIFDKQLETEIFTKNPIILELKGLRGDFDS